MMGQPNEIPPVERDVNRPRAAHDFATIRARMEELRREREGEAAEGDLRSGKHRCTAPEPSADRRRNRCRAGADGC